MSRKLKSPLVLLDECHLTELKTLVRALINVLLKKLLSISTEELRLM
mgnify:CR=1 FL=1